MHLSFPPFYDVTTTMLDHRDGISQVMSSVWSSPDKVLGVLPREFNLCLTTPENHFLMLSESFKWCLANSKQRHMPLTQDWPPSGLIDDTEMVFLPTRSSISAEYAQSSLIPLLHQISSSSWTGYVRVPGTFLLATEPAPFPPVLSEAIIILDASSVEDVAQCTGKVNSSSKTVDHIDYMQAFALLDQLLMIRQFLTWLLHCYHLHLLCPTCRMWHAPWFCQSLLFRSRKTCYFLASAGNQLLRFQTSLFFSQNALNVS